jgi:hypothetical protein
VSLPILFLLWFSEPLFFFFKECFCCFNSLHFSLSHEVMCVSFWFCSWRV